MSHISRVCSRKSSGRPLAGRSIVNERAVRVLGAVLGLVLVVAHALDALLHFAHAGQVFVQLGLSVGADLPAQARRRRSLRDRGCSGCAGCRGSRTGCRRPATDRLRLGTGESALCQEMCEL